MTENIDNKSEAERVQENTAFDDIEFLNFIFGLSHLGYWKWDATLDSLIVSDSFKKGIEIVKSGTHYKIQDFWNCCHTDDLEAIQSQFDNCKNNNENIDIDVRVRSVDSQSWLWMRLQCEKLGGNKKERIVLAGSLTNINEAHILKQSLQQQSTELRFIFDHVPAKIWYKDNQNKILRLNKRAADSMGISIEEGEGRDTYELFPEMAKKYHQDDLKVIESGMPLIGMIEEYTPKGAQRGWVRTDKFPYKDPITGEQTILAMAVDVTKQLDIETELRLKKEALDEAVRGLEQSHDRFSLATKGSSVGIWEWPIQGQTPVYWSPVYYNLLGYEDKEILASYDAYRESVHPDDEEMFFDELERCIGTQKKLKIETRIRHKSGSYRWFLVSGEGEWDDDGTPLRMIGSIMDIHDLKVEQFKSEAYLDKLEDANKELENFAYVASHDLKAPLRSMDNLAVWIEEDLGVAIPAGVSEKLALLRGRILRLEDMLKDILAFSYAGKKQTEAEELDMQALIDEIIVWLSPKAGIIIKKSSNFPKIVAVKTMMEQIILNLLSNAIKHNAGNKAVIQIEGFETKDTYKIIVTDNGPGIDEKYRDYVFELFKTLKPRDKVDGSGIGLSIVKKIVESMGGKIWIESAEHGKGTAFHVQLPKVVLDNPIIAPEV